MTRVPKIPLVRYVSRAVSRLRGEAGIGMVEMLIATLIFAAIAAPLATVLTSSTNSHRDSRQKTLAQQIAMEQIEEIRQMVYEDVGTQGGNPAGELPPSQPIPAVKGLQGTITIQVVYVDDPTPTSYATSANYKQVTVSVFRATDSKLLTREVTYMAPPERAPFGGINNAIANVQVVDSALNTPVDGVLVNLTGGPPGFSARSDTTGVTGLVTFAALTPNGPSDYYDIAVSKSGYVTLSDDVSPGSAAHLQLAPSQTFNTAIRIYKPATIDVIVHNFDGSVYTGTGTVTVLSSRGAQTFAYSGSTLTITSVNGEQVVPSLQYTVSAQTTGGIPSPLVTQYVPDDYPSDLSSSFTLTFPQTGTVLATVTWAGTAVSGATVVLSGGPQSLSVTGTTNSSGQVTFVNVPEGSGYTITATKSGQSAGPSEVTVTPDQTTDVTLALPTGNVAVTATQGGAPADGATITISGGPLSITATGTANGSGQLTFANVPAGSGYTVTASKGGQTANASASVTGGQTTDVSIAIPVPPGNVAVTVTWAGMPVNAASVTLSGGPNGINVTFPTNSSGQVTFTNVPVGNGYTVAAQKSGQSAPPATNQTVASGGTTDVSLALPTATLTLTVKWPDSGNANRPAPGWAVALTGGPMSIAPPSPTTNPSGQVTFTNVPVGTGYSIAVSKSGQASPSPLTNQTVNAPSTSLTVTLPTGTLSVTVKRGSPSPAANTTCKGSTVTVSGGPNSISPALSGTTNSFNGNPATFTVPAGSGSYTVTAQDGSLGPATTTVSVTGTGTTPLTVWVSSTNGSC